MLIVGEALVQQAPQWPYSHKTAGGAAEITADREAR
jgi:hypothetical protein